MTPYTARDDSLRITFAPAALEVLRQNEREAQDRAGTWGIILGMMGVFVGVFLIYGAVTGDFLVFRRLVLLALLGVPAFLFPVIRFFQSWSAAREARAEIDELEALLRRYNRKI
jgi:hypothetical protein